MRAAIISSSRAARISGIDSQMNAMNDSARSIHECCFTAASTPSGIASAQVTNAAAPASISVFVNPSLSTSNTG